MGSWIRTNSDDGKVILKSCESSYHKGKFGYHLDKVLQVFVFLTKEHESMIARTVAALGLALLVGCGQSATPEKDPAGGQAGVSGDVDPNVTQVVLNVPGMN